MKFNHKNENVLKACGFEDTDELAGVLAKIYDKKVINTSFSDKEKIALIYLNIQKDPMAFQLILEDITGQNFNSVSKTIEYLFNTLTKEGYRKLVLKITMDMMEN